MVIETDVRKTAFDRTQEIIDKDLDSKFRGDQGAKEGLTLPKNLRILGDDLPTISDHLNRIEQLALGVIDNVKMIRDLFSS